MNKNIWEGKHLVIVGAARQGLALAKYMIGKNVRITITDQKDDKKLESVIKEFQGMDIQWALGGHSEWLLKTADGLSLSGGIPLSIPLVKSAIERGIPLTNDSQIFLELVSCPVIGITGSAGKTTTTLLVGEMAKAAYGQSRCWVGGNLGNPLIADVDHIKPDHLAVVELSSFQLEIMTTAPTIACITNLTPNHLDRHGTMEEYTRAKSRILDYQNGNDLAVLNRDDPGCWELRSRVKGKLISFGIQKPAGDQPGTYLDGENISYWDGEISQILVPTDLIQLRGRHNLVNVLGACAIAKAADLPINAILEGVKTLEGVEHRLEFVRSWGGASWFNDSIATAPERSIAAIQTFEEPLVLLAGGRDKDLPWEVFAKLVQNRIRELILFGEAADLIEGAVKEALREGQSGVPCHKVTGLKQAVELAANLIQPGDVVLLSPGGTSFDEFRDFEERGEEFRRCVHKLS
jgi:UDP-N-acetylmuramoylalanine--D-glutamate ligase